MTEVTVYRRRLERAATEAEWSAANPVLGRAELGIVLGDDDAPVDFKVGDGVTAWTALPLFSASLATAAGSIPAAEKGADGGVATLDGDGALPEGQVPARLSPASLTASIGEVVSADADDPDSEIGTVLGTNFVRAGRASTAVGFGDSHTAGNVNESTGLYGENHFTYACALLGQRLRMLAVRGVAGERVDEMEDRLDADVIALAPGWCYILGGTNDVLQDTLPAAKAALERMVPKLRKNGVEPILCTIPPNSTQAARARLWNAYLKRYAAANDILLVDYYGALVDPTTGTWKAGYDSGDGTHWTIAGALAAGQEAADTLSAHLPPAAIPLVQDDSSTLNMLTKGMFTGTINGTTGVPQGWSSGQSNAGGYGTMSIVDGSGSNPGKWFQIDKTGSTQFSVNQIKTTGFSEGDRIAFMGKFELETPAGGVYASVNMMFRTAGGVLISQVVPLHQFKQDVRDLTFYCEGVVPATTGQIRADFNTSSGGTGKVRAGQMTLVNLTTGAILL